MTSSLKVFPLTQIGKNIIQSSRSKPCHQGVLYQYYFKLLGKHAGSGEGFHQGESCVFLRSFSLGTQVIFFLSFIFFDEKIANKGSASHWLYLLVDQKSWLWSNSAFMSIIVLLQVLPSSFPVTCYMACGNLKALFQHRVESRQFKSPSSAEEGLQSNVGLFPWVNFWYLKYCDF